MENNKFERIIYRLLRILGVLSIVAGFLGDDAIYNHDILRVGHVVFISPIPIVEMTISIVLYLIFIRILERHIRISKKSV